MGVLFGNSEGRLKLEEDDYKTLSRQVFAKFGWPNVKIEITENQFKECIRDSVFYLNTYSPRITLSYQSLVARQGEYILSEYKSINAVLDMCVSTNYLISIGMPYQNLISPFMSLAASRDPSIIEGWVSVFSQYGLAKRMFGAMPNAERVHPNKVRISPVPFMNYDCAFLISIDHTENLSSLNQWEIQWFVEYVTAAVGIVIGETRRKYDGVTLPVGSLSTSGGSLVGEYNAKKEALITEIKGRRKIPEAFVLIG